MAGRRPKPTALKKLQGNPGGRPLNDSEPKIVFCDADVRSFAPGYVLGLVGPLLDHDDLQVVKGFYDRPLDGRAGEGGGALTSQAIHQADVLLHLMGAVDEVFGYWHLGATHKIESEDLVCAVMRYASGATGVIQAATALWPRSQLSRVAWPSSPTKTPAC